MSILLSVSLKRSREAASNPFFSAAFRSLSLAFIILVLFSMVLFTFYFVFFHLFFPWMPQYFFYVLVMFFSRFNYVFSRFYFPIRSGDSKAQNLSRINRFGKGFAIQFAVRRFRDFCPWLWSVLFTFFERFTYVFVHFRSNVFSRF